MNVPGQLPSVPIKALLIGPLMLSRRKETIGGIRAPEMSNDVFSTICLFESFWVKKVRINPEIRAVAAARANSALVRKINPRINPERKITHTWFLRWYLDRK